MENSYAAAAPIRPKDQDEPPFNYLTVMSSINKVPGAAPSKAGVLYRVENTPLPGQRVPPASMSLDSPAFRLISS